MTDGIDVPVADEELYTVETEHLLLNALALGESHDIAAVVDYLEPADFYAPKHRAVFEAAKQCFRQNGELNWATIAELCMTAKCFGSPRSGVMFVLDIVEYAFRASGSDLKYLATRVKSWALKRKAKVLGYGINETDPEAWLEKAQERWNEIIKQKERGADLVFSAAEAFVQGVAEPVAPWLWTDLEALLQGIREGHLIVIGGWAGVGKTTLALNIVNDVAVDKQKQTVFVSTEIDAPALLEVLTACRSGVDMNKRRRGYASAEEETKWSLALASITEAPLHILTTDNITEIVSLAAGLKPKLLVVDYIQNIKAPQNLHGNRAQEVAYISRELKTFATRHRCAVIAISQLRRPDKERKPRLFDLKESGDIENDADVVLLLWRSDKNRKSTGTLEVNIAKNRWGETGTRRLAYNFTIRRLLNHTDA